MDDETIGRVIGAVRRALGLRQSDVGRLAGVDQKVVSLLERGQLAHVSVPRFRAVCAALDIRATLDLRWRGAVLDRLIDRAHAEIVEQVASVLVAVGWEVLPEFTFNVYGERGSVDLIAWHPIHRALLIIEVKTVLSNLQALLMSMSRKLRLVPPLVAEERGWERLALGRILVVAGTRANRSVVLRHAATFQATFPSATADCRRWVSSPNRDFAGVWFVAPRRASPSTGTPAGRAGRRHA